MSGRLRYQLGHCDVDSPELAAQIFPLAPQQLQQRILFKLSTIRFFRLLQQLSCQVQQLRVLGARGREFCCSALLWRGGGSLP